MENQKSEEKTEDVVLLGIEEIEKRLRKSYLILLDLKKSYGFPLKKTDGLPSINLRELNEWVKEWGGGRPFEKITAKVLYDRYVRLEIEAMPSKPLCGINAIVGFCGCPADEVLNWHKYGVDCPIKKDKTGFSVDGKDLRLWMYKTEIRQNKEERSLDSF